MEMLRKLFCCGSNSNEVVAQGEEVDAHLQLLTTIRRLEMETENVAVAQDIDEFEVNREENEKNEQIHAVQDEELDPKKLHAMNRRLQMEVAELKTFAEATERFSQFKIDLIRKSNDRRMDEKNDRIYELLEELKVYKECVAKSKKTVDGLRVAWQAKKEGPMCGICYLRYHENLVPVMFACGHSLCFECASTMIAQSVIYGRLACPFCRTGLPTLQSAEQLPKNFALLECAIEAKQAPRQSRTSTN